MRMNVGSKTLLGALLLGGALLVAGHSAFGQAPGGGNGPHTMTGVVSDAMCGGNHNGKDAAKCTNSCASKGKYALVIGDRVVTLDEVPTADIAKLAGQKVIVTGTMSGKDNMKVTKVEAAKDAS
jgi:hypothetical protein